MQQTTNSSSLSKDQLLIVAGLMTAVSLAALDMTVVATVMPTVAGALGGLDLFSWTFSVYLLTSTVTVPIYGKLADLYGRKPILLAGAVMFIAGSILCGAAQSMEMLIVFRAVQGLGAGAVLPITITIVGDIFTIEQRSKVQGFMSGVWGVAGVAGPALGGLITDTAGWRWVFYLNLPFGLAAIALISKYYVERTEKKPHVLDYWGGLLLTGAVVALLMAFLDGGERFGWASIETLGMFGSALLLLALFLRQEMRAPEPVIPLSLFRNRIIAVSSVAVFVAGGVMFGVTSYVPLFEQGVFGGSATEAGMVLAPMSVAWVIAAMICGKAILRVGYYPAAMTGGALLVAGAAVLLALTYSTSIWVAVVAGTIIGAGMGFATNSTIIAVQNAVDWSQRGVATATTMFFRTIGGSIGIAIMGAMLNSRLAGRFASIEGAPAGLEAESLLDDAERALIPEAVVEAMQRALASSLHEMFFVVFAAGAICLAVLTLFPRGQVGELADVGTRRNVHPEPEPAEPTAAAMH